MTDTVDLRFGPDGTVSLHTGVQARGQGHLPTDPRLVAERLGIDPAAVRLIQATATAYPPARRASPRVPS